MAPVLLERPVASAGPRRRPRRLLPAALAALALLLAVLLAGPGLDLLPGPFDRRTVDRSAPALLLALEDVGEYHAARARFQEVVDLERDTPWLPALVSGERTTYLAVGHVDGVVDLRGLGPEAVRTSGDGTAVTLTLPRPRLDRPVLDLEASRVVARDRGLVERVSGAFVDSPTTERRVQAVALDRLAAAAAESDLLRRSEAETRETLSALARSLGFARVEVRFAKADPAGL